MAVQPLPNFEAAFMAMNRVEELLRKVTLALDAAKIPYAVVGGNAVAAWVATADRDAVRATKDVDLLVRRESITAMTATLEKIGFEFVEVHGVHMFVEKADPSPKRGVHLVLCNEKVRPHYAHAAPELCNAVMSESGFKVIDLYSLVIMKLQSFRDIDRAHVRDLISVGLITKQLSAKLPADLRVRLRQIEETPE
jgi:predicted RNA binding protein YcfA (HicA-like mRNA interferase family)